MKKRYVVLFSFLGLFSLFLLIHYANLMINGEPPPPPRQRASLPERGSILDRNGRFLALSIRFADVSVWRPSIPRAGNSQNLPCLDIIAEELADILEMTPDEIRTRITASESNFLYLRRQIDDATARRLSALIRERRIRGIIVQPVSGRVYPEGNLASQVVGFVGNTNEGIEFAFDNILSGVNNDGIGSDVVLTIDVHVQYILHQIAERTKQETQAESIIFVAMDPRNGYILGSVSLPDFDPNNFRVSDANSRMNRPAIWAFEPGSTFKVYTMAALLDAGAIRHDSVFFCNGVFMPARGAPITCLVNHGRVTAREIVILSCNVGAAYASQNISPAAFHRSLSDLGFGSRTGAGSPGETAGYFAPVSSWSDRSKPTIAFGQEIAVSAYQILKATSAIANDGILVPPRLVSRIVSPDGRTSSEWESG
ncbi:MAG: penicillin-binding transpeptidase domain-containing protein, partial [Treponema sp.]|nr:penicillin-binding transpeptidase domain-containing protein [Treponema sp.]